MSGKNAKDLAAKCTAIVKRQADNSLVWQCPLGYCSTTHQGERALELHLKKDHGYVAIAALANVWDLVGFLELIRGLQVCQDPAQATADQKSMLLCPACRSIGASGSEQTFTQHISGRPQCAEWSRDTLPQLEAVLLPRDDTGSDDDDDTRPAKAQTAGGPQQQEEQEDDEDWEDDDSDFDMEIEARCLYCDTLSSSVLAHMKESHECDLPQVLAKYRKEIKSQKKGAASPSGAATAGGTSTSQEKPESVVQAEVDTSRLEYFNIRFVNFVRAILKKNSCPSCGCAGSEAAPLLQHIQETKHFGPATVADFPNDFHDSEDLLVPFLPKDGLIQIVLMMGQGGANEEESDDDEADYPMVASLAELAAKREQE